MLLYNGVIISIILFASFSLAFSRYLIFSCRVFRLFGGFLFSCVISFS